MEICGTLPLKVSTFAPDCRSFLSYMSSERYYDVTVNQRCAVQRKETSKIEDKYSPAYHFSSFQSSSFKFTGWFYYFLVS